MQIDCGQFFATCVGWNLVLCWLWNYCSENGSWMSRTIICAMFVSSSIIDIRSARALHFGANIRECCGISFQLCHYNLLLTTKITSIIFLSIRVFLQTHIIDNNANIGIRDFTTWKQKKSSNKMLPLVSIEFLDLWFQVQHSSFWTNMAFACKTETVGSLYSHVLLILTESFKSKNQVVYEQKLKDVLSSTCQVSPERRVLNLESEVQRFNANILLLEVFVFT